MTFRGKIPMTEMELRTEGAQATILLMGTMVSAMLIYICLDKGNWLGGIIAFPALTVCLWRKFWKLYTKKREFIEE